MVNGLKVQVINGKDHPALQGTYFRTSDVMPQVIDNEVLQVVSGAGYKASWGSSNVHSTVTVLADDVVMVEVVGWHKHTVSPVGGNYYFVNENGTWKRRKANHHRVAEVLNSR